MKTINLIAASLLTANQAQAVTVQSYTANEPGFSVNSHLIMGKTDAILVDAQFTRSNAKNVVSMIKASGKNLKMIFITHGHPDHYFGLDVIQAAFPNARVVATSDVVSSIKATAQGKLDYWKPLYKDDLTDKVILPEVYTGDKLTIEGEELNLVRLQSGESESATAVYIPSVKGLVAGDLVYSSVHLWLAEERPQGWIANLNLVKSLFEIKTVYAGHGPTGTEQLLDNNIQYINDFVGIVKQGLTKEEALKRLVSKYSQFKLPIIAELSVGAAIK